jgi:hypothetical protein
MLVGLGTGGAALEVGSPARSGGHINAARIVRRSQIRRSKNPRFRQSGPRVDVAIFRRPAMPPRHWRRYRRGDDRFRADVLGHEFGMLAQPET